LVLGYGLGSVSELLAPYFDRLDIDGIEIDQEIIDWEVEYGFEKEQFNIKITQADAINWMDKTEEKYDLILLDLFIDNTVPVDFETSEFLGKLAMRLNTKGLVLFNRLSFTQSLKDQTETVFQTMKQVFPNSYQLPIKGNTMIVSSKN
jgi:spermidine synthase